MHSLRDIAEERIGFRLHPARAIILSFVTMIVVGAVLLRLPCAAVGPRLRFVDALFTATSATCVTGLVVVDTGSRLTSFGQLVVLTLIQVGGLGIMTFSLLFLYMITHRFSIRGRELLEQTLTQRPLQNLGGLLTSVFVSTFAVEAVGAMILTLRFSAEYPLGRAAYMGVFHSVSAFCNAGFALFSDSFIRYGSDLIVSLTVMILIVAGGLGFIVLFDLLGGIRWRRPYWEFRFSLHTKIVLATSAALILLGAGFVLAIESSNTLSAQSWPAKVLSSFFQSITARTAGFMTVDTGFLSSSTLMLLMGLMLVGASPGSCGGGIKTSTLALLMAMMLARYRNVEDINISNRRISQAAITKALAIAVFAIIVVGLFALALSITEVGAISYRRSEVRLLEVLFETVSAFGTVGLSTGITPDLSDCGRVLLILLMLIGRLGPLTLAIAIGRGRRPAAAFRYPEGSVLVG